VGGGTAFHTGGAGPAFRSAAVGPGPGFTGGHFHPGFDHGFHHGFHRGFRGPFFFGFGVGPYAYYDDYYDYPYYDEGCYIVRQRVLTPYGWRLRPVQVCS
jgi:hypothetical protein